MLACARLGAVHSVVFGGFASKQQDPEGALIGRYDLGRFRTLFLAGERLDPDTLRWAQAKLGVPVIDHWWQTETGWSICANCIGIEALAIGAGRSEDTCKGRGTRQEQESGTAAPDAHLRRAFGGQVGHRPPAGAIGRIGGAVFIGRRRRSDRGRSTEQLHHPPFASDGARNRRAVKTRTLPPGGNAPVLAPAFEEYVPAPVQTCNRLVVSLPGGGPATLPVAAPLTSFGLRTPMRFTKKRIPARSPLGRFPHGTAPPPRPPARSPAAVGARSGPPPPSARRGSG